MKPTTYVREKSTHLINVLLGYFIIFHDLVRQERRGETDIYNFSSWFWFPLYEVDFGWGKPIWVSTRAKTLEMVILNDTKDGDGIEAWVSLDEKKNCICFRIIP